MEPIHNWARLSRHDEVSVYCGSEKLALGRVDMLALDGSVLWILQSDGKGRAMFHWSDGVRIFRHPATNGKKAPGGYYKI
jgi:hypothetical protein